MNSSNEQKLLLKLRLNNDPDAFAGLYDLHVHHVYRFIYFKVGNEQEAQDLTSEVFLKAWSACREKGKEIRFFRAFIYQIARNTVVDYYRSRRQVVPIETVEKNAFISATNLELLSDTEKLHDVLCSLKQLKEEYRELIMFRYVEDMKIGEIAEITGKSGLNVRVTLHRAMNALKKILKEK